MTGDMIRKAPLMPSDASPQSVARRSIFMPGPRASHSSTAILLAGLTRPKVASRTAVRKSYSTDPSYVRGPVGQVRKPVLRDPTRSQDREPDRTRPEGEDGGLRRVRRAGQLHRDEVAHRGRGHGRLLHR